MNWNDDFPVMNVYLVVLAARDPSRFKEELPQGRDAVVGKVGPGISFSDFLWGKRKSNSWWRRIGEYVGNFCQNLDRL